MGLPRQKRKNRSALPRTTQHTSSSKPGTRGIPQDPLIASRWDRSATLSQNYRRLGLASKLTSRTGGVEKVATSTEPIPTSKLQPIRNSTAKNLIPTEVRVRRDPETGAILEVFHTKPRRENPLGDLINDVEDRMEDELEEEEDDDDDEYAGKKDRGIVRELEERAAMVAPRQPRKQSKREQEWIERLVRKHGEDYARMARDMKLNPMQQTEADIKRRAVKWRKSKKGEEAGGE